jgi:subtilisin-like proprotein convertase family protein
MKLMTRTKTWLAAMAMCTGMCCAVSAQAQANDLCSGAIPLTVNTEYYGSSATATDANDGPAPACQTSFGHSVWYTFNPATSGNFQISACGTQYDSVLTVFDAVDCTTYVSGSFNQIGCDDDSCGALPGPTANGSGNASLIATLALNAGTNYYIRLSGFSTNSGIYQLAVFDLAANGACCTNTGTCSVVAATACSTTGSAYFLGANTTCTVNPCMGACCNNSTGTCAVTQPGSTHCVSGNSFMGYGTTCAGSPCTLAACCSSSSVCTLKTALACSASATSTYIPSASSCSPGNPCTANSGACCNVTTFVCSATAPASCAAPNTFAGLGTTCVTNPCPPPVNDVCSGAVALTLGTARTDNNSTALDNDGPASTCQSNAAHGVWYTFMSGPTPGIGYRISTCSDAGPGGFDSVLTVYTIGDCADTGTWTTVGCDDDDGPACETTSASIDVTATPNTLYYVRFQGYNTNAGTFSIVVNALIPTGSCCDNASGACTLLFGGSCATGTSPGTDATCGPSTCVAAGTCCDNASGACTQIFGGSCPSGATAGTGTTGDASACPAIGTCCDNASGACTQIFGGSCATGLVPNASLTCTTDLCPSTGACCNGTSCTITLSTDCTGLYFGANTSCEGGPNVSESPAAAIPDANEGVTPPTVGTLVRTLVVPDTGSLTSLAVTLDLIHGFTADLRIRITSPSGTVTILANRPGGTSAAPVCPADFAGGDTAKSYDGVYVISDSGVTGINAAILATGGTLPSGTYQAQDCDNTLISLNSVFAGEPISGSWTLEITDRDAIGAGTLRAWNLIVNGGTAPPCSVSGACCVGASCTLVTSSTACSGAFTLGGACTAGVCGSASGVCCRGATCNTTITSAGACTGSGTAGAFFSTTGSTCNTGAVSNSPCCYADYNKAGGITVQDIFDFLSDWFAGNTFAKVGGDGATGGLTVQNIFDFLSDWFTGGCS